MENIYSILAKYFNNQCSDEEKSIVDTWKKNNTAEFDEHEAIWSLSKDHEYIEFDSHAAWNDIQPKLASKKNETKVVSLTTRLSQFAAAAVVILVCVFGISQYMGETRVGDNNLFAEGFNKEFEDITVRGVEIISSKTVEAQELANGDKIWLNKNSKVEDLGEGKDGSYGVKLHQGEAFFDVKSRKRNPDEPFLVHTRNGAVSVVGTEFSVAYRKEKSIVRVQEGVVSVMASDLNSISLKTGEQAYIIDGNIQKTDSFSPNFLSWKTGKFNFEDMPIEKVVFLLQTYYDVKIEVKEGTGATTTGLFEKMDIKDLLTAISLSSGLKLEELEERKHYKISQ